MLPTFVIGLREGLEASLIVGIIAAFLIQRGERRALRPMWLGVAAAAALCLGVAVVLRAIDESLPLQQREGFEAVLALAAVAGDHVHDRVDAPPLPGLKGSLERSAGEALASGSTWALVAMAFLAVLREGLETAVFLLATFQNSTNPVATGARCRARHLRGRGTRDRHLPRRRADQPRPGSSGSPGSCSRSWPPGSSRSACTRPRRPAGSRACNPPPST